MISNRSIPGNSVIPELPYPDVAKAVEWLCSTFGFTVRLTIANHRAQLNVGDAAVVVMESRLDGGVQGHSRSEVSYVLVRVEDVIRHHERTRQRGATILRPPADHPYGERQYTAQDLAGHVWTFSESIADVAPESWGGTSVNL